MTQADTVLHHLQTVGPITSLQAVQLYGILRMPNRVCELRKLGWNIKGENVVYKDKDGKTKKYMRYTLE